MRELLYLPTRLALFYLFLIPAGLAMVAAPLLWLMLRPFGFRIRLNPFIYIQVAQDTSAAAASRAIGSHVKPPWPDSPWQRQP